MVLVSGYSASASKGGNCTRLAWNREMLLGSDSVDTVSSCPSPLPSSALLLQLGVSVEEKVDGRRWWLARQACDVLLRSLIEETSGPWIKAFWATGWHLTGWPWSGWWWWW